MTIGLLTLGACASGLQGLHHQSKGDSQALGSEDLVDPEAFVPASMATAPGESGTQPIPPSKEEIAEAKAALNRGLQAYHEGRYPQAEQELKEAMTLYPFLAEAYLTLGKIYLVRGVAAQDARRLDRARRLVEMACRLDPKATAAQDFLALFNKRDDPSRSKP